MNKKILRPILVVFALILLLSVSCAAESDTAGNAFLVTDDIFETEEITRDLYWAGNNRAFNGLAVGRSMLLAGRDISVSNTTVGGSLRAGGNTILVNSTEVSDNVTAAGYSVQLSDVRAAGIYLAGNTINFSGEADSAVLMGRSVSLDGTVHGDVLILADSVTLGSDLNVEGKLTVRSDKEPAMPSDALLGSYEFEQTGESVEVGNEAVQVKIEKKSGNGFGRFVKGLFGNLLLAALICLLLGRENMLKPGRMLFESPLPMLGIGFASLFVIPGIILILLLIGIGLPSAGLLALLFALVCIYAVIFTGTTLANTLIPQFTDNKWLINVWSCSLIGALVFWLLRKIPVVGRILLLASLAYSLGYFVRSVYLRLRGNAPRGPKGKTAEKADAPASNGDALEPVKKADAEDYVDPVLAEAKELFTVHEEPVQPETEESVSEETPDDGNATETDADNSAPEA